jgi:hypothetical protein
MDPVQIVAGIIIGKIPTIEPQTALAIAFDIVHAMGKLHTVKAAEPPVTP